MDLGSLKKAPGSHRENKRLGRGQASGTGGTAGRGHKGARSRSGAKRRAWFEGGQMPIQRRLPKFGFYHHGKIVYQVVNLGDLNRLDENAEVTPEVLMKSGLVKSTKKPVKILGDGELTKKISVKVNAVSKSAREQIEKRGGSVTLI